MAPPLGKVETGRVYPRSRTYECHSCQQRNAIGAPHTSDTWPARIHAKPLTEEQADLLLQAAVEFHQLCEEAGEYDHAVDFVDWVRPDALNRASHP